jgi:hypothetical protein
LDTGRIVAELKRERDRLSQAIAALEGQITKSHCEEECCSASSHSQQKEAGPSHPGRQKAVVRDDEEAMGGEKKERFQQALIRSRTSLCGA